MKTVIEANQLSKTFLTRETFPGFLGSLRSLFTSKKKEINSVSSISFSIREAERVAFIGPNGAGKSTTIKMLTGILYPSSGTLKVMGKVPWKERKALGYEIAAVFGQRSQLWYHLPPSDTFDLLAKIYEIDKCAYKKRIQYLIELFELENFLNKPVRQLSLGERMRCEIVASLLHQPKILFLDEPTIGLDIHAKLVIRNLLTRLSRELKTTLFLTSHDTADIEQICDRVIVVDQGSLLRDTSVENLKKTYRVKKNLHLVTEKEILNFDFPGVKVLEQDKFNLRCEVNTEKASISAVISAVMAISAIKDISVEDMPMEEIIQFLYRAK